MSMFLEICIGIFLLSAATSLCCCFKNKDWSMIFSGKWGKVPLCNEKAERAPHIGRFCFPLCWRCTMIMVGLIIGAFVCRCISPGIQTGLIFSILIIPCLIDGLRQRYTSYVSTNLKRILFGFMAGVGMFVFTFSFCFFCFSLLNTWKVYFNRDVIEQDIYMSDAVQ